MKQFKVLKHPTGDVQVVKQGWCWPAFFFSFIWAMVSKMWALGVGALIGFFALGIVIGLSVPPELQDGIINLVAIAVNIYFGSSGNQLREKHLISRGFELKDTVTAANKDGAVALFLKNSGAVQG